MKIYATKLFILRNPARRTLRKRMGAMMYSQLSYVTLLQAFARGGKCLGLPFKPVHVTYTVALIKQPCQPIPPAVHLMLP